MHNAELQQRKQYLQQEYAKADAQVQQVLLAEAGRYRTAAEMREALQQARKTRRWVTDRLAELDETTIWAALR